MMYKYRTSWHLVAIQQINLLNIYQRYLLILQWKIFCCSYEKITYSIIFVE